MLEDRRRRLQKYSHAQRERFHLCLNGVVKLPTMSAEFLRYCPYVVEKEFFSYMELPLINSHSSNMFTFSKVNYNYQLFYCEWVVIQQAMTHSVYPVHNSFLGMYVNC